MSAWVPKVEPGNLMVVIDPLLGLDVSIKVRTVLVNTKNYGRRTWHYASPHLRSNILLTLHGSCIQALALVIGAIVETLTKILSVIAPETWH